jgi:hypothetical protein
VVRLELIEIQERAEEARQREAKAVLKTGSKDHIFALLGDRLQLFTGNPAGHLFRYSPGPV